MKPLPAAPLTEEDRLVNFAFVSRYRLSLFAAKVLLDSADADRRDAAAMLYIELLPPVSGSVFASGCWAKAHRLLSDELAL